MRYFMKAREKKTENIVTIVFEPDGNKYTISQGISIFEAAIRSGSNLRSECGGKGKCGKCRIIVKEKNALTEVTKDEMNHLSSLEIKQGYRLACQAFVKRNVVVFVPPESRVASRKIQSTGLKRAVTVDSPVEKIFLQVQNPTLSDIRSDLRRLLDCLESEHGLEGLDIDYEVLKKLPNVLREKEGNVTVTTWNKCNIIAEEPGNTSDRKYGLAIDVGTSKIVVYLVDLTSGDTSGVGFVENPQIIYGEDIITRIYHTMTDNAGLITLQSLTIRGINEALQTACKEAGVDKQHIYEASVVGNTAMHHFLLAIEPRFISTSPFVPAIKRSMNVVARKLGIDMNPNGIVHILPIIAGFVGADAIADILSSGIDESENLSLLLDIGTNTEIFVGNSDDIIACSCASGPAFEGGHIKHGMKAVTGAIEKVSIDPETLQTEYETIGGGKPRGLCGSAIVDVVAELLKCGIINGRGRFVKEVETPRLRETNGNFEFVLVSSEDSATGQEIVITQKDISEVQLAKAAIYSGCSLLMKRKEMKDEDLKQILIAGAFGNYINPENAKQIGLIPDLPTEKIRFVGNTAITGAKMAIISKEVREQADGLSRRVRYLELSTDPDFSREFSAALFLPHRDVDRFPSIKEG